MGAFAVKKCLASGTDRMVLITGGAYQTATRIEITAAVLPKTRIFLFLNHRAILKRNRAY